MNININVNTNIISNINRKCATMSETKGTTAGRPWQTDRARLRTPSHSKIVQIHQILLDNGAKHKNKISTLRRAIFVLLRSPPRINIIIIIIIIIIIVIKIFVDNDNDDDNDDVDAET